MERSPDLPDPLVQIVGPTDNWILQKLSSVLVGKLPYSKFAAWRPDRQGRLAYYVNYALYERPSGLIDVGFFTHRDDTHDFLERARSIHCCVCMASVYADWLKDRTPREVAHIRMGFDAYRYRPSLVLGVIGRLDHPRKGRHLVERIRQLPFIELVATEGMLPQESLRELYQRVDYVLIPATVEGGPLSLLEGLAMGKPVIAPEGVGAVPELCPTERILLYPAGDAEALTQLVTDCYRKKLQHAAVVADRSWDHWAEDHHALFVRLLKNNGITMPPPGPGFRFGMMRELDLSSDKGISPSQDLTDLESAIDRAAAYLYYDMTEPARAILKLAAKRYPQVDRLIATLPQT
ncbi:MAG: glycosyltransferase [Planctomycetaceae bacterium]